MILKHSLLVFLKVKVHKTKDSLCSFEQKSASKHLVPADPRAPEQVKLSSESWATA